MLHGLQHSAGIAPANWFRRHPNGCLRLIFSAAGEAVSTEQQGPVMQGVRSLVGNMSQYCSIDPLYLAEPSTFYAWMRTALASACDNMWP